MTETVTNHKSPAVGDVIALIDVDGVECHFRLYGGGGTPFEINGDLGFYIGKPDTGRPSGNIWFKRTPDYTTYVVPSRTDSEKLAEIRNIVANGHASVNDILEVLDS